MVNRSRAIRSRAPAIGPMSLAADLAEIPLDTRAISAGHPARHGLLVALVGASGVPSTSASPWPLWLVPGITRRTGPANSRTNPSPRKE